MEKTTIVITITAQDEEARDLAIEEITRQLREGFTSGCDRNDEESFEWSLTTEKL